MKKALLTIVLSMAMMAASEAQVLPLLPTNHGLSGNQPAYNSQQQQEFPTIAQGWNWWSTYIDLSDDGLAKLETALGSRATVVKSKTQYNVYSSGVWAGNLEALDNASMYAIQMVSVPTAPDYVSMSGTALTVNDVEITAHHGWSWVGYPSSTSVSLNEALANYSAQDGDVIKSKSSYASYLSNSWQGTLTALTPGQGYMINNNGVETSFHYSAATRNNFATQIDPITHWTPSNHDFATNMTMTSVIRLMGEELRDGNYEVAAFCGDDCRGAVVPMYIEDVDRYIAFLTISGDDGNALQFRLIDNETGNIYLASNRYSYNTDDIVGSIPEPYVLNFDYCMGNEELVANHLQLFPNPVMRGSQVTATIPTTDRIDMTLEIINMMGVVVKSERMTQSSVNFAANLTPGIYTVKVVANDKQMYFEKLIVE